METYISSIEYEKCNYMHPKKQKRRGSKQLCQELSEREEEANMHPIRLYKNCQKTNQNLKNKNHTLHYPISEHTQPKRSKNSKIQIFDIFLHPFLVSKQLSC